MEMLIKYRKKSTLVTLLMGIASILIGIYLLNYSTRFNNLFFVGAGVFYDGMALYNYKFQYASITDYYIKKSGLFSKKIMLDDITSAKRFASDYIYKAGNKTITLDNTYISKESKSDLENFFQLVRSRLNDKEFDTP